MYENSGGNGRRNGNDHYLSLRGAVLPAASAPPAAGDLDRAIPPSPSAAAAAAPAAAVAPAESPPVALEAAAGSCTSVLFDWGCEDAA